jgi:photosystem II stability/assembly factor-like uncharacterized protein
MNIYLLPILLFFQCISCNGELEIPQASDLTNNEQTQKTNKAENSIIVLRSADGGRTWQNISKGLPAPVKDNNGASRHVFFTDDNGLYLCADNGIYHNKPNSKIPFWTKDIFPDSLPRFIGEHSTIAHGNAGIYAANYQGEILQKASGTNAWSQVFKNFQKKRIRTVFETAGGTVFIHCDNGLYKSTDSGKTWKELHAGGWGKMVESNGVLLATSQGGILRSTDDGENWALVISEGGVGIDVERIEGGFAAITYSTLSKSRRIRTSYDGGKTWQAIDAGLRAHGFIGPILQPVNANLPAGGFSDSTWQPKDTTSLSLPKYITTIVQVGEDFFCGHSDGIYRSSDKGKTWKLVLPSAEEKMFKVSVSGNVIYAIQMESHC